jgi:hypothetical protein
MGPTEEQAYQFAVMLAAGLPASEAILYFAETDDAAELAALIGKWMRSRLVKKATLQLMKKPWQDMNLEERAKYALDLHYSQLAYMLYSHHYAEVEQQNKAKLDTARQALEAKLAGYAGKGDALSRFFEDLRSERIKLPKPVAVLN